MPKAASGFLEDEGSFESNIWEVCWIEKGQHSTLNLCSYQWELLAAVAELLSLSVSLGILCPRSCLTPELMIPGCPEKKLCLGDEETGFFVVVVVIFKLFSVEGPTSTENNLYR